jgi:hypothetical protein
MAQTLSDLILGDRPSNTADLNITKLSRSNRRVDPREVQAMFADVAGSAGIPFGYPTGMALRGKTEEAKTQAAIEAALLGLPAAGPLARLAGRGAKTVGKEAARVIDKAMMEGAGPLTGLILEGARPAFVVKPKGGNWLTGSVEDLVHPLKTQDIGRDPANRLRDIEASLAQNIEAGIPVDAGVVERERTRLAPAIAANRWLESKLTKYIRNEMGTPEDPIRLQADAFATRKGELLAQKDAQLTKAVSDMEAARQARGFTPEMMTSSQERIRQLQKERDFIEAQQGLHFDPPPEGHMNWRRADNTIESRKLGGYPLEGLAGSDVGRRWELLSDSAIFPLKAEGYLQAYTPNSDLVEKNPWLLKVPPETVVHDIGPHSVELGFNHIIDELKNAMNPGSGLPEEFLIDPAALEKMSVPDVVKRVDDINAWRTVQKAEANAAIAGNSATSLIKEYPETGKRWVELKLPEDGDQKLLEQALQYEGEQLAHCVGGYCPDVVSGNARIFSLRDRGGKPHTTIELKKGISSDPDQMEPDYFDFLEKSDLEEGTDEFLDAWDKHVEQSKLQPPRLNQIKGFRNQPPREHVDSVLDFLSQQHPDIGITDEGKRDLRNLGIVDTHPEHGNWRSKIDDMLGSEMDGHLSSQSRESEINDIMRTMVQENPDSSRFIKSDDFRDLVGQYKGYAEGGSVKSPGFNFEHISLLADAL